MSNYKIGDIVEFSDSPGHKFKIIGTFKGIDGVFWVEPVDDTYDWGIVFPVTANASLFA